MTHAHVTSWFVALILFFVVYNMQKNGKAKPAKIVKMVLRLFYLIILATGGHLFGVWASAGGLSVVIILKALFGLWVIFSMEFVLNRQAKNQPTKIFWIQLILSLLLAIIFGWVVI